MENCYYKIPLPQSLLESNKDLEKDVLEQVLVPWADKRTASVRGYKRGTAREHRQFHSDFGGYRYAQKLGFQLTPHSHTYTPTHTHTHIHTLTPPHPHIMS